MIFCSPPREIRNFSNPVGDSSRRKKRARERVRYCKVASRTGREREAGRVPCLLTFFLSDVYIGSSYSFVSFYQRFRNAFLKEREGGKLGEFDFLLLHRWFGRRKFLFQGQCFNENLYYLAEGMCSS